MSETVNIAATVTGPAEQAKAIEEALRRCMAPSRAEAACQRYIVARDLNHAGRFVLDEAWASPAEFEAHLATPHFRELAAMLEKLGARVEVSKIIPIEPLS